MDSASDVSGDDIKPDLHEMILRRERVGADPTEGWRRGTRGELRKSCDACTASKTKCCGDIPCNRCKKRNLECKFSKRRRCGPKARPVEEKDEKRARTGQHNDSDKDRDSGDASTATAYASGHNREYLTPPPPPRYSQASSISRDSVPLTLADTSNQRNMQQHQQQHHLPSVPGSHSEGGGKMGAFTAPLAADELSGLAKLIAPSLSDTGGSGSSGMSGLGGQGDSSSFPGSRRNGSTSTSQGVHASLPAIMGMSDIGNTAPTTSATISSASSSGVANGAMSDAQMRSAGDDTPSLPAFMAPSSGSKLTADNLLGGGAFGGGGDSTTTVAASAAATAAQSVLIRGALPMEPPSPRARAHLAAFLRSVGSFLPLPGTESLQEAMERWGGDADAGGDEMDTRPAPSSSPARRRSRQQPMGPQHCQTRLPPRHKAGKGVGEQRGDRAGEAEQELRDKDSGSGNVELDEACRAEAWAAIALGALFSGGGDGEARDFAARSLRALPRCLDAPLAEVASVFLLHALFWLQSLEKRKAARYFGFAQQVAIELGPLLPQEVRHSMAFVSLLVSMAIDKNEASSLGIEVRDIAFWGLSSGVGAGVSPQLGGLEAVTSACNEILSEQCSSPPFGAAARGRAMPSRPPLSQALTDMLSAAAEPLQALKERDSSQPLDHLLVLLSGLQGYTHSRRGETAQAQAAARVTLELFGHDPNMVHLLLTRTLVDAAERVLEPASGRFGTSVPSWCPFAQEILRAAGNDATTGTDFSTKANNGGINASPSSRHSTTQRGSRGRSMSPPPGRSAKHALSRAELASRTWKATTADSRRANSIGTLLEPPRSVENAININRANSVPSRWPLPSPVSSPILVSRPETNTVCSSDSSDWVERVRYLGTNPNSIQRTGTVTAAAAASPATDRAPLMHERPSGGVRPGTGAGNGGRSPRGDASSTPNELVLGPMPAGTPMPRRGHVSEPVGAGGLSLLPGAAPGSYGRGYMSHEGMKSEGGNDAGGERGVSSGAGDSGEGREEDLADDPPPQSVPLMKHPFSFDPNREDPQLNAMLY